MPASAARHCGRLGGIVSEAASLGFTTNSGVSCENVTCDFSDASCPVLVHPEELKNCLVAAPPSPSGSEQNVALTCRMDCGSKSVKLDVRRTS